MARIGRLQLFGGGWLSGAYVTSSAALSFDALRPWEGAVSRAFEELTYQLLKDHAPPSTRAIRTGNPDGGVEWYAALPDGSEWGWQAKHVHGIDALLTAMTDSVKRVCKERKNLRKLTFAISENLSTGTLEGQRKSQRQKYEDRVASWQRNIEGADSIAFELVQGSDLLAILAKPEHQGRVWFWWGGLKLGADWLQARYQEQADAATEKYRPDLQVDVPIQDELVALGFGQGALDTFHTLRQRVRAAIAQINLRFDPVKPGAAEYERLEASIADLSAQLVAVANLTAAQPADELGPVLQALDACGEALREAEDFERRQTAELQAAEPDAERRPEGPRVARGYGMNSLSSAMYELAGWLRATEGRALQARTYLLTGQAGSGKTHLFLDATRRALAEGRPAIFLAGAQFGHGNLWASFTDQLGLEPVGSSVLLQAMDAAGEAAAKNGRRFTIFIDALNETTPPDFWYKHLPQLRAAVAPYQHVSLAVSCRDTYQELVLDTSEAQRFLRRRHPGFQEREVEATQRYFNHYGLEAPRIPLLTPEFTLPLFLRLYCESLAQADGPTPPTGHQGRITIFNRYLETKTAKVGRRLRPAAGSAYELAAAQRQVRTVMNSLLDEMSRADREGLAADVAETVATTALGSAAEAARVIGLLQDEGVLTRELLYLSGGTRADGVRIVFQAFADFLLLQRRLNTVTEPLSDPAVLEWLRTDASWGVLEAASVMLPEAFGSELLDALAIHPASEPDVEIEDTSESRQQRYREADMRQLLLRTLPYRASEAVTERTIELINAALPYTPLDEFYRTLFLLAPQPGNRLNGDRLHEYLQQFRMPERDEAFGIATYYELTDEYSPAARLARWAAAGPYPQYDNEVLELACIPLCWLLSSPHRPMRDWTTKALVQLLRGHLDVMAALIRRFWIVNDPYVVQRVVVIAYGAVMRSKPQHRDRAQLVAETVRDLVFAAPVRPDELLLDAARGVVRWAVSNQLLPEDDIEVTRRPYGLRRPGPPPSEATIEERYPWNHTAPDDESYSSIRFSLLSLGDFGNYVIEPGLRSFSLYPLRDPYPEPQSREGRFVKRRWKAFVRSLDADQVQQLAARGQEPEAVAADGSFMTRYTDPFVTSLTDEQWKLLQATWVYPKRRDDEYPVAGARRWVFRRTISLGWTPQLFGAFDRRIGHGGGREGHKPERFGKKYEWMAYHELLARVADNYHWLRRWGDDGPYEGLHQIIADREIDPSLPPIPFRAFMAEDAEADAWHRPPVELPTWPPGRLDFGPFNGDITTFLADVASEPSLEQLVKIVDQTGEEWIVLDGHITQTDPSHPVSWRGLRQLSWVNTLLVPRQQARKFVLGAAEGRGQGVRDVVDTHGHVDCCYVGEVGRAAPRCPHRQAEPRQVEVNDGVFDVISPLEEYTWEGSLYDCSINETIRVYLPSAFMQMDANLDFDAHGPSWLDEDGQPQFVNYWPAVGDGATMLVRAKFLASVLAAHDFELVALAGYERIEIDDHIGMGRHAFLRVTMEGRMGADLHLKMHAEPQREVGGNDSD